MHGGRHRGRRSTGDTPVIAGLLMLAGGAAAGVFGSLLGLGGGILIVPLLTLGFGLPLREAVGVSLVSVIVTSSAAAGVYLERHVANLRLGMALELFSASGALVGGLVAFMLYEQVLAGLFAALLIYVAITMVRRREPAPAAGALGRRRTGCADRRGPDVHGHASAGPATASTASRGHGGLAPRRARVGPARHRRRDRQGARPCTSRWASRSASPPRPAT